MKLAIGKGALSRALGNVARVVEARNILPILGHIRLSAGATLTVTATDMDIEATDTAEADVSTKGAICVDAKLFTDIVKKCGDDLSIAMETDKLIVKSGRSRFSLATLPADDFPDMPAANYDAEFEIDLAALFGPCAHAMSNEETRYYLNGVFFKGGPDGDGAGTLTAVATDGHRMVRNTLAGDAEFRGIIVPKKLVGLLPKGVATVAVSDSRIRITAGDLVMVSKLIDGTFPDYVRVIPRNGDKRVTVDSAEVVRAADRVSSISTARGRPVKLSITPGGIVFTAHSDVGDASDEIAADYSGEPIDVGYNAVYLRDALSVMPGGRATLVLSDAGAPGLLVPADAGGLDITIMPMRV